MGHFKEDIYNPLIIRYFMLLNKLKLLSVPSSVLVPSKRIKMIIGGFGLFLLLTTLITLYYKVNFSTEKESKHQNFRVEKFEGPTGKNLSYVKYIGNKKLFSFKTEEFRIWRKEIGFLRVGFYKVAYMKKVRISIYDYSGPNRVQKLTDYDNQIAPLDFMSYFQDNESIDLFTMKGVKEFDINGVVIKNYKNDMAISEVSSKRMSLNLKTRDISFTGGVRISAGEGGKKSLECESIVWINDSRRFQANGNYRLRRGKAVIEGRGLETDYLLEYINLIP